MSTAGLILFCALAGFVPTLLLVGPVRRLSVWVGAVDEPDGVRKVHTRATPRLGGLAIFAGLAAALVAEAYYHPWYLGVLTDTGTNWEFVAGLGIAAVLILALGVIDDVAGLRARTKLLGQVTAAVVVVWLVSDLRVRSLVGIPLHWLSAPVTVLWLVACANAVNLIDGLDGLAAGVSFIALFTVVIFGAILQNWIIVVLAGTLCGSILGFLIFNWPPAVIFLGGQREPFSGVRDRGDLGQGIAQESRGVRVRRGAAAAGAADDGHGVRGGQALGGRAARIEGGSGARASPAERVGVLPQADPDLPLRGVRDLRGAGAHRELPAGGMGGGGAAGAGCGDPVGGAGAVGASGGDLFAAARGSCSSAGAGAETANGAGRAS
ncbi:MAG: MraY family glycosyltransferase [Planctomycetota bacterium]